MVTPVLGIKSCHISDCKKEIDTDQKVYKCCKELFCKDHETKHKCSGRCHHCFNKLTLVEKNLKCHCVGIFCFKHMSPLDHNCPKTKATDEPEEGQSKIKGRFHNESWGTGDPSGSY